MLHKRLVTALVKIGAKVEERERGFKDTHCKHFVATLGSESIDWYTSRNWNKKLNDYDDQLYVDNVVKRSPHTDAMTDCFCDSFRDTIKAAIGLLSRQGY